MESTHAFPYDHTTEYSHWDSGLWARVLAASGVRNPLTDAAFTEAMLAGLAGGIGFMIFTFEYKDITTASAVTRFHPGPYTENLLRRSGAAVNIQQTGSASLAQSRLDAALETGIPAVVRVVRGKLPWVAQDPLADMESVDVAVVGRDGEDYLMDDGGGRLERISSVALAQARGTRKADKHWQAHVVVGSRALPEELVGEALTVEVIRQAMAQTAQELLSEQAPHGVPAGYAKNFGIRGMSTWAQRLSDDATSKHGWLRIFVTRNVRRWVWACCTVCWPDGGSVDPAPCVRCMRNSCGRWRKSQRGSPASNVAVYKKPPHNMPRWGTLGRAHRPVSGAGDPDFAAMAAQVEAIAVLEHAAAGTLESAAGVI
ncbi:BtrH N-terminal domain-containing protein [Arthrobacter alpinus]|nr:BtrH N-terminal domain-containing protein [Arthrobacter alpinus]